jgi:hypothetical protein
MHAAATRSIIAAAGIVAIGLVAWPHQAAPRQAQHGVPAVHLDVALVDTDTAILGDETSYDNKLFDNYFGPDGKEAALYDKVVAADGSTEAAVKLDIPPGTDPPYAGNYDGAESRLLEGLYIEKLVSEDMLNREVLGVDKAASETAILADITSHPGAFPLPPGDTLPAVNAADFDTYLQEIKHGDFVLARQDFETYLGSMHSAASGASEFTSAAATASDVGGAGELGSLSGDLSSFLSELGNIF